MSKNTAEEWQPEVAPDATKLSYKDELLVIGSRLSLAAIFWMSGRTKVSGWIEISDSTIELFQTEYDLPIVPPEWGAHLAAYAEHLFPILLVLGLMTRLSALALLGMTAVIASERLRTLMAQVERIARSNASRSSHSVR